MGVFIPDAPVIDKSPQYSKAASEEKSTGKLICKASGAPSITFTWFKVVGRTALQ